MLHKCPQRSRVCRLLGNLYSIFCSTPHLPGTPCKSSLQATKKSNRTLVMHIMKRGLNYLRSGGRAPKQKDPPPEKENPTSPEEVGSSTAIDRLQVVHSTPIRPQKGKPVSAAVNSRWSPQNYEECSLSSTGATLTSDEEQSPESSVTTDHTDHETYFEFERDLDSQHYIAKHHQRLQRMSTRKLSHSEGNLNSDDPGSLNLPAYLTTVGHPNSNLILGRSDYPDYLAPPPPSPEFRALSRSSRVTIPRCSSRNSLDFDDENMIDNLENRPSSSQTAPEALYSEVRKPGRPVRKRVCFRDPMSLSAIQEVSPVSIANQSPSTIDHVIPRRLSVGFPTPSPFKSPAKPLPKTNPHFTLPKSFGTQLNKHRVEYSSMERVGSYYDSDEGSFSSYSTGDGSSRLRKSRTGGASVAMNRVLAGLKSFGIKGELYVTIVLNRGLLTITIDECRNLVPPCSGPANGYVRLSLMPDEEKRTHCRTSLIPRSNNPVFNQTFTIELLPEDYTKRLLISIWHRDLNTQKSSLLGCMAFTVKHLMNSNKEVDGWYFLLAPSFGRQKHLAVDKVNMLTYYGSVDSGLQASSGTSLSSQDDQSSLIGGKAANGRRDKRTVRRRPPPPQLFLPPPSSFTDTSSSASAMTSTSAATSATTSSASSAASGAKQFFGQIRAISPLRKVSSSKDTKKKNVIGNQAVQRKISAPACTATEKASSSNSLTVPYCGETGVASDPVKFTVSGSPQGSLSSSPANNIFDNDDDISAQIAADAKKRGEEYLKLCEALDDSIILSQRQQEAGAGQIGAMDSIRRTRSYSGGTINPLQQRNATDTCGRASNGQSEQSGMKKKLSFAGPIAKKFSFLKRRPATDTAITAADVGKPARAEVERWATSFDILLRHKHGLQLFRLFLQREFSEENIDFWIACEEFKKLKEAKMSAKAKQIYAEYVQVQAPKEVNLDSTTRASTEEWVNSDQPLNQAFDHAQHRIQNLMEKDSYPRFLKSDLYLDLINGFKK